MTSSVLVGQVSEVWRYPVKSMAGEALPRSPIGAKGIWGDRGWAVRDERVGEIRGAKKIPALMQCFARYAEEPGEGQIPNAIITLPNGTLIRTDAPDINERLSQVLGTTVTLWPLQPETAVEHYRRGPPDLAKPENELRKIYGRKPDEPLPDLNMFPAALREELAKYASPLGTYFDAYPLHVLTTSSLLRARKHHPNARWDIRRFRPNLVIETEGEGAPEFDWVGRSLRIGSVLIDITIPTVRCIMPTLPLAYLAGDQSVLRTIIRRFSQNFGVYATVVEPGTVSVGDPVEILAASTQYDAPTTAQAG